MTTPRESVTVRRVEIIVTCDVCRGDIDEETEGSNKMQIIVGNETREMDICPVCLYGSFLQEARPVTKRKSKGDKNVPCEHCSKSFATERGLKRHLTMIHS